MYIKQIAPRSAIVSTLRKFGPTHVGSLANQIGRKPSEVQSYVKGLESAGVVRSSGDIVSLVSDSAPEQSS